MIRSLAEKKDMQREMQQAAQDDISQREKFLRKFRELKEYIRMMLT